MPRANRSEIESIGGSVPSILLVIGACHPGVAVVGKFIEVHHTDLEPHLESSNKFLNRAAGKTLSDLIYNEYEAFNETELLPALSRSWTDLAPVDWALLPPNKKQNLALIAGACIKRVCSSDSCQIVIVDSRHACLLPFWAEVIQSLGQSMKIACVICSPREVALSMHESLGISVDHCYLFYVSYWLNALPTVFHHLHCFTSYQSLTHHPETELARIRHCLSLPSYPVSQSHLAQGLDDDSNRQLNAEMVYSNTDNKSTPSCQSLANRIYLQLLSNCSLDPEDQIPVQIDEDICMWYNQSISLMRAYDQLNTNYRQSREEALLLRAANQGYAEYFSLNGLAVDS